MYRNQKPSEFSIIQQILYMFVSCIYVIAQNVLTEVHHQPSGINRFYSWRCKNQDRVFKISLNS